MSSKQQKQECADVDQPVGTQILDANMPSNLDFDSKEGKEVEMAEIGKQAPLASPTTAALSAVQIKSYVVKGEGVFDPEPKHTVGSVLMASAHSFAVRAYDDQPSGGWRRFWEALVGYCSRQLLFEGGYIYLLQGEGKGDSRVIARWKMVDLFKVYVDSQESRLRLVLRQQGEHLTNKDYVSVHWKEILKVLGQQLGAIGLTMSG